MASLWNFWKALEPTVTTSIASCVGQICVQPLDTVTIQIQLNAAEGKSTSPLNVALALTKDEGVWVLYTGVGAAIVRTVIYSVTRMHLYDYLQEATKNRVSTAQMKKRKTTPFWKNIVASTTAGALAGFTANLADLALVRLQAEIRLPSAERHGFDGFGAVVAAVAREEGVAGLLVGSCISAVRAAALNVGVVVFTATAKTWLARLGFNKQSRDAAAVASAGLAGLPAAALSLPFDYVQTQVHASSPTVFTLDPLKLYAGFPCYYLRTASHSMITFLCQFETRRILERYGLRER